MSIEDCNDYAADFERTEDESSIAKIIEYLRENNMYSLAELIAEYKELKEKIMLEEYLPESTVEERVKEQTDNLKEAVKKMIDYYTYECFDDRRERFGYAILPLREVENMESMFHELFGEFE